MSARMVDPGRYEPHVDERTGRAKVVRNFHRRVFWRGTSKYRRDQGAKECDRRRQQAARR